MCRKVVLVKYFIDRFELHALHRPFPSTASVARTQTLVGGGGPVSFLVFPAEFEQHSADVMNVSSMKEAF